jgi:hypothetical protein
LPIALLAFAFFVVFASGAFVVIKIVAGSRTDVVRVPKNDSLEDDDPVPKRKTATATPTRSQPADSSNTTPADRIPITDSPAGSGVNTTVSSLPAGKRYLDLSESEKRTYIGEKSMRIAQVIGNSNPDQIPAAAVDRIKAFTDAYAKRISVKPLGGCRFGDNLQATYERASKNAPFIVKAFNEKGIDPRIGLYLAMIESEHCVCLQSPTGPLGMFQFTTSTGAMHGLKTVRGATPQNPDERCEPEPSARAAANYMKALTGRYGTGPSSVPLAIGSYNSGEGGLSSNLVKALESGKGLERDFWTLISKGDILSKQFQSENFKYVPKFFAAAIVGENPDDFGLKLQPLSTYSK